MISRLLIVALFAGFVVSGCGEDRCLSGDRTRCDGDVIQECDGYAWIDLEDCAESDAGPFCSQLAGGDAYCTDGTF